MKYKLPRRNFLKHAIITSAGLILSACGVEATQEPGLTATSTPASLPIVQTTASPTVTIPPLPTVTSVPSPTSTPRPPTIGELGRKLGFDVGMSLRMIDAFNDPPYQKFLQNFSILADGWASNPVHTDNTKNEWGNKKFTIEYLNTLSAFCKSHNMSFDLNHLYYGFGYFQKNSPVYYLNTASKEEIDTWYQNRVKMFFEIPYFTSANFVNEVIPNDPSNLNYNWGADFNPLYRIYGKEYPYESYKVAWNEAVRTGRKVGEDIHLIYNTASLELKTPGADFEYQYLLSLRDKLSKEFSISRPFDIGLQLHIGTAPIKNGECWRWDAKYYELKALTERFRRLGEIGDIRITEFSIADTQEAQQQKDILHTVVEAYIASGVGKSFIMWSPQDQFDNDKSRINLSCAMRNLMDAAYRPMFMFNELYDLLKSKV